MNPNFKKYFVVAVGVLTLSFVSVADESPFDLSQLDEDIEAALNEAENSISIEVERIIDGHYHDHSAAIFVVPEVGPSSSSDPYHRLTAADRRLLSICREPGRVRTREVNVWSKALPYRRRGSQDIEFYHMPYDGGLDEGEVNFTFDDGPNMITSRGRPTEKVQQILKYCGIHANFFMVGRRLRQGDNPEMIRKLVADGHTLGTHSMRHENTRGLRRSQYEEHLARPARILSEIASIPHSPFFRLPFGSGHVPQGQARAGGRLTNKTMAIHRFLHRNRMIDFFWNMSTGDSDPRHPRRAPQIASHTISEIRRSAHGDPLGHGILLAHDARPHLPDALPRIIRFMIEDGYTFVVFRDGSEDALRRQLRR